MSWPCKYKRSNEGCGSHADEGNFSAEGEGTQEAQMLRGDILERGNFAGEKNKRSVASYELRVWGKASTLWFF